MNTPVYEQNAAHLLPEHIHAEHLDISPKDPDIQCQYCGATEGDAPLGMRTMKFDDLCRGCWLDTVGA